MEEGASPPRWALDKKLGEDASMEEKKEGEKERMIWSFNSLEIIVGRKWWWNHQWKEQI